MSKSALLPLAGKIIAVTRPEGQAADLTRLIVAAGGGVLRVPLLQIGAFDDDASLRRVQEHLADYSLAVFVSPNAVKFGLQVLQRQVSWPAALLAVAPGSGTANALAASGIEKVLMPEGRHDSESVLQLPELQAEAVRGRRVLIFRGDGGRALLAETLMARGAKVDVVTCYRRLPIPGVAARLLAAGRDGRLDALVMTSSEALRHLHTTCEDYKPGFLTAIPVFVSHERIFEMAIRLGLHHTVLTAPGDAGVVESLCAYNWP